MPILSEEINFFPPDLFHQEADQNETGNCVTGSGEIDGNERRWWAIYTKARQEKALARQLLAYEIPFFLPLISHTNVIRGRKIRTFVPLFDGYVFLYGTDEERRKSLTTNRISKILDVDHQRDFSDDLRAVQQLIAADAPLSIERRLVTGDRVRVKEGALKGLEGTIERREGCDRLVVAVRYLQQGVSMEIDDYMLEEL